jgi:heme-degrading monooxygenase HmoA
LRLTCFFGLILAYRNDIIIQQKISIMETIEKPFTTAVWNVRQGKEKEFIKEWTRFADWSSRTAGAITGRLLQDTENPTRFISVGEWDDENTIKKWREQPEFREAMSALSDLLAEPVEPKRMKEVAKVGELIIG